MPRSNIMLGPSSNDYVEWSARCETGSVVLAMCENVHMHDASFEAAYPNLIQNWSLLAESFLNNCQYGCYNGPFLPNTRE